MQDLKMPCNAHFCLKELKAFFTHAAFRRFAGFPTHHAEFQITGSRAGEVTKCQMLIAQDCAYIQILMKS